MNIINTPEQIDIEDAEVLGSTPQRAVPGVASGSFVAGAGDLASGISAIADVVDASSGIPILACLKIQTSANGLSLSGTDLERSAETTIPAQVSHFPVAIVRASAMQDFVRKIPKGTEISATVDRETLRLKGGRFSASIPMLPAEDFPIWGVRTFDCEFALSARILLSMIDKVRFAAEVNMARPSLMGIYIHAAEGDLRAVGANGGCLAIASTPLPIAAAAFSGAILPLKTVASLVKMMAGSADEIAISATSSLIRFRVGGTILLSKLVNGPYVEYERIIPEKGSHTWRVAADQLRSSIDVASAFSDGRDRAIKVALAPEAAIISSVDGQGNATAEISAGDMDYAGDTMEVGFKSQYIGAIARLGRGDIELSIKVPNEPVLVHDTSDPSVRFVLSTYKV